jgi:uncharacterized repeat protein (TIGR03803 family)
MSNRTRSGEAFGIVLAVTVFSALLLAFQAGGLIAGSVVPVGSSVDLPTASLPNSNGYKVTQGFGKPNHGHTGVDLANGTGGGQVRAAAAGVVVWRQDEDAKTGWGYMVRIRHTLPSGLFIYTQYGHMEAGSILVNPTDHVAAGQPIGKVGNTGNVSGATGLHLHFEVKTIDTSGCGYLPDKNCPNDSFANYLDPLVFLGSQPAVGLVSMTPAVPVQSRTDQVVSVMGSGFATGMTIYVTLPDNTTVPLGSAAIQNVAANGFGFQAHMTLANPGAYGLRVENLFGQQSGFLPFSVGAPGPPPGPPTAGFTMSAQGQSATNGGQINPGVDVGQTVPVTLSADCQVRGPITGCSFASGAHLVSHWAWTVSGVSPSPADMSTVTVNLGSGPHTVTLVVTDDTGLHSTAATGSVLVGTVAGITTSVWPMSGHDPRRTALSAFNGPTAQPTSPAWTFATSAPVVGDLAVSAEGRVYAAGRRLYALNSDGTQYAVADLPSPSASQPSPTFLTSPAIDDANGFVYVGETSTDGGWDVVRFNKDLTSPLVAAHGNQASNRVSNLIVDGGSVFFFVGGQAYAVGLLSWVSDTCTPTAVIGGVATGQSWSRAPTIGRDGQVYGVCGVLEPGPVDSTALLRLDRNTGTMTANAFSQRGAGEITIDGTGSLRIGSQAFTGAVFAGSYDRFDPDLNHLNGSSGDLTSGRTSVLPDGSSTVRIGYGFQLDQVLSARDPNLGRLWDVELPRPDSFTTNPSVDQSGRIYIGGLSGLFAVRSSDGGTDWSFSTPSSVTTQPAIGDGAVYFATSDGTVYSLRQVNSPPPPPTNQPPLAGFTMSAQGTTVYDGHTLMVVAGVGQSSVTVNLSSPVCPGLPSGCSIDTNPGGNIAKWSWVVTGLSQPLTGSSPSTSLGIGTHTVTLTVTDTVGLTAMASGTIQVSGPAPPVSLSHLTASTGSPLTSPLVDGHDGFLYGAGTAGGQFNDGTIFKVDVATGTISVLYDFQGPDGIQPYSGLTRATDGLFYGTTRYGGLSGRGTVFSISSSGSFTSLYSFGPSDPFSGHFSPDGLTPQGRLVQGADGALYGTASQGGINDGGTIFRVTTDGQFSVLYSFDPSSLARGFSPSAGLILASDGYFYGTTNGGGDNDDGIVFRFDGSNVTPLHSFAACDLNGACADGVDPQDSLVEGPDGALYGAALGGGDTIPSTRSGGGTIFRITTSGVFSVLHTFIVADGVNPYGALIVGQDGALYGTTAFRGANAAGTVFRITPGGVFTLLANLGTAATGSFSLTGLVQIDSGDLFGSTELESDQTGFGVIFRIALNAQPPGGGTTAGVFSPTRFDTRPPKPRFSATFRNR